MEIMGQGNAQDAAIVKLSELHRDDKTTASLDIYIIC